MFGGRNAVRNQMMYDPRLLVVWDKGTRGVVDVQNVSGERRAIIEKFWLDLWVRPVLGCRKVWPESGFKRVGQAQSPHDGFKRVQYALPQDAPRKLSSGPLWDYSEDFYVRGACADTNMRQRSVICVLL